MSIAYKGSLYEKELFKYKLNKSVILRTMIYHQGLYKYNYTFGKRDILDCIFVSSS